MKRSSQVALLLMGTVAVGGGAYALMPSENCQPNQPGLAQPGSPQTQCSPRSSSSSSSGYRGGSGWSSSSSSSRQGFTGDASSGSSTVHGGSAPVARGGFGSFASHFTGGG
jgi:hypothetical protein